MLKKRILVLASRFPYPPLSGGKQTLLHAAASLTGYDLTLLSLCATREEMDFEPDDGIFAEVHKVYLHKYTSYWNALTSLAGRDPIQLAYYWSASFRAKCDELLPLHDAVLAHLIRTGQYVTESHRKIPSILLMSDAISLAYQRLTKLSGTSILWRVLSRVEFSRLSFYERTCPKKFDLVWLHSNIDRQYLELMRDSVKVIPVGIDLDEFPFSASHEGNVIAFVGNMSFSLNIDACRYFIREIFPKVRSSAGLRFRVIGACSPAVKNELERYPGVEVTGTVRSIAEATEEVFCGVCPVRAGAGIQNKILNYLALGIPCVTSEVGLEGLDAVEGQDLLVYRLPDEAINHILGLHTDFTLRRKLAMNGRRYVEGAHNWKTIQTSIREDVAGMFTSQPSLLTNSSSSTLNEEEIHTKLTC